MERSNYLNKCKSSIIILDLSTNNCSIKLSNIIKNEINKESQNSFLIFSMDDTRAETICPLEISKFYFIYDRELSSEQLPFNLNGPEKNKILLLSYVLNKLGFSSLRKNLNFYPNNISNSLLNSIKKFWDDHFSEFVNIINYCISKNPNIFINKRSIDLIIEKLKKNDESVLPILTTSFEHWINNNCNFINLTGLLLNTIETEKLIEKLIKYEGSSKVEEFFAIFIIFLYEQLKPINNYFTDDYLEKLVNSFLKSEFKPYQPRFERNMRATICICNYYCETNNPNNRNKAIRWFRSMLQKIFPCENVSNIPDESYLYERESDDENNLSKSLGSTDNNNNESCFISCDSDSSNDSESSEPDKSENLFNNLYDYCPYKNNDIYYYIESNLHSDLKKKILTSNGEFDDTMKSVSENFLKLWSISDHESTLITLLKNFINKNLELGKDIEVIAKIIIFSSKPVESKEDFYVYINDKLIQKTIIDKEDIFRLFQERFDIIYTDFNRSQEKKKNIIIHFCSLLIDNSNSLSFENQIDFYIKKYDIKDTNYNGRRLFIKYIINHYIQICLEKNIRNDFCLGLVTLISKFLPSNEIGEFPKVLEDYMKTSNKIYFLLYVLKQMLFITENLTCRKCIINSVECLASSVIQYDSYYKEIFIFFMDALKIFKIKKENTLYNLCKIPIAIIKKYNKKKNNPDDKIKDIYSQIKNIFINNNSYDFSKYPVIEVLSLCVTNEGNSFLNNVKQLDNIILDIPERIKYKWSPICKQDIINTIEAIEKLYTSRNNNEMAKIASNKKKLFQ